MFKNYAFLFCVVFFILSCKEGNTTSSYTITTEILEEGDWIEAFGVQVVSGSRSYTNGGRGCLQIDTTDFADLKVMVHRGGIAPSPPIIVCDNTDKSAVQCGSPDSYIIKKEEFLEKYKMIKSSNEDKSLNCEILQKSASSYRLCKDPCPPI